MRGSKIVRDVLIPLAVVGSINCGEKVNGRISWGEYENSGVRSCQMGSDGGVVVVHTAEDLAAACKEVIGIFSLEEEILDPAKDAVVICIGVEGTEGSYDQVIITSCSGLAVGSTGCFATATTYMNGVDGEKGACGVSKELGADQRLRCPDANYPNTAGAYCGESEFEVTNYRTTAPDGYESDSSRGEESINDTGIKEAWIEEIYKKILLVVNSSTDSATDSAVESQTP